MTASADRVLRTKCNFKDLQKSSPNLNFTCNLSPDPGGYGYEQRMAHNKPFFGPVNEPNTLTWTSEAIWPLHSQCDLKRRGSLTVEKDHTYVGVRDPFLVMAYVMIYSIDLFWNNFVPPAGPLGASHAEMCILSPCVRSYNIRVVNGSPVIDIVPEDYGCASQELLNFKSPREHEPEDLVACW